MKTSPWPFIGYALLAVVFGIFSQLVWLNHHTSRTSSTLVLLFFPVYAIVWVISLRTAIITGALSGELSRTLSGRLCIAREALWISSLGFGFIGFVLELFCPEKRWKQWRAPWARGGVRLEDDEEDFNGVNGASKENDEVESPVATANIYER